MERTTFTISKEFAEKIKTYEGRNDEERLKNWANASRPDEVFSEDEQKKIMEIVRDKINEEVDSPLE
jgi:hypothetical protein